MRHPLVRGLLARCFPPAVGLAALLLLAGFEIHPEWRLSNRHEEHLGAGWRFHPGDAPGAEEPGFGDSHWQTVHVPHDWSISGPRAQDAAAGMPGGYAPSGIGWYRRTLDVPAAWKDRTAWLVFDGAYRNSQVWLNGQHVGGHPYGYSQFRCDVSSVLKPGETNILAVRVDNSAQPNSRWYSGSGLYRHVWIEIVDPVHIAPNGVTVSTARIDPKKARLNVRTTVENRTDQRHKVRLETRVLRHEEKPLVLKTRTVLVPPGASLDVPQELSVSSPVPWSPDTPELYTLVTRVVVGDRFADKIETSFGIRTARVSPERGFELNGQPLKLNGANVHHDHGPLGAAAYSDAEYRQVRLLKAAGFNAVRTSHNPPSPAFLQACDQLGLLVMDEAFDCWAQGKVAHDYSGHFQDWWQRDLDAMILRDRNHPSVVMWSIGNEIQEVGRPEGIALAQQLAARVRNLDPTRPVACGWTVPWILPSEWIDVDPSFASVDVAGYNYQHHRVAEDHARVPDRVMVATESYQADTFAVWSVVQDHPFFIGDFVWTGWDYLGESGIGRVYPPGEKVFQHWETEHWPWYGAYCGDIDITGWRKPISHYRNIVWDRGEKLFVAVQEPPPTPGAWQPTMWGVPPTLDSWTWPGHEGETMIVEVYSRHDSVQLFLNDHLIGEKPTTRAEAFKAVFEVPYEPGVLRAVGVSHGKDAETFTLETTGPAVGVRLVPDWGCDRLLRSEIMFARAEIIDAAGRLVPTSNAAINFSVSAGGRIVAVATGDLTTPEPYVASSRQARKGRAMVIVAPANWSEELTITATVPELGNASASLGVAEEVLVDEF